MSETNQNQQAAVTVTEEDLQKSLDTLQGKPVEKTPPAEPTLETAKLEKTAAQSIKDKASEPLKKALEVSSVLNESINLMGLHVDESLTVLQKSIQAQAKRDLAFTTIMQEMKKSMDAMAAKLEEYGKLPAGAPKTLTTGAPGTQEVMQKSAAAGAGADGEKKMGVDLSSTRGKKAVLLALESLQKSAKDPRDANSFTRAAIKFESTGIIDDAVLMTIRPVLKDMGAVA